MKVALLLWLLWLASATSPLRRRRRASVSVLRGGASEELYEAYNELHVLASAYERPIRPPAVVVVGAQSCGKSALIEALMGFQFNEVGGGTRTRRPISLRMKYSADCDEPKCYVRDERFYTEDAVDLRQVQAFVQAENRRLENDAHRSFEKKDIDVRVEYRYCPNLVLVDTPGLLAYSDDVDSAKWKRQALEAVELALEKCKVKEHVLLCVEDSADWAVDSVARKLCRRADPEGRRTILVNTKLDTKLVQFSRRQDVLDFLKAKHLTTKKKALLGGPFFTSVPAGRVTTSSSRQGFDDDDDDDDEVIFDFKSDAEYRAAVERASASDLSLIRSRVGSSSSGDVFDQDRVGVSALRLFLERYVDSAYRSNVAKVLPELEAERQRVTRKLRDARQELDHLSPRRLKRSAEAVADTFCRSLAAAVAGAVAAPPTEFGEHLADERVAAGAFLKEVSSSSTASSSEGGGGGRGRAEDDDDDDSENNGRGRRPRGRKKKPILSGGFQLRTVQAELDRSVGHAEARLYGGAQYRRTLREFALAVRRSAPPVCDRDEIANALGVGDAHDGADFVRAACVIAVEKARKSFEPQLDTLALRVCHVMRRLPPALLYMMHKKKETSTSGGRAPHEDVFLDVVTRTYDEYATQAAEKAASRCRDDLAAMTRFVTWDLAAAQTDALTAVRDHLNLKDAVRLVEATAGPEDAVTDEERDVVSEWREAAQNDDAEAAGRQTDDERHAYDAVSSSSSMDDDDVAHVETTAELLDELSSRTAEEIHHSESSLHAVVMVESLVRRIAAAWREHFARTVAVKFNCFFLMPFVDDFPLAIREKIDDLFAPPSGDDDQEGAVRPASFDVDAARRTLQTRVTSLEKELDANTRLVHKFQRIQRSLGVATNDQAPENDETTRGTETTPLR
eukprot:CAMPEP_0118903590 /NCGR_PEP_ID=MMETSP1166-20130328/8393_1 /TAXON_ID=1104430 /ORGANISM="Chrysoreinhardia sp, Strain CCMP3193" /LENGTH=905 /DNA_ID=CAMNT_0006842821 /DNA_START=16 /DNA_END=2733 /DNA_ORIENTATION=+